MHPYFEFSTIISTQRFLNATIFLFLHFLSCNRYELNAPLTEAHMLELWAILCKLHQYGVVHRDVRPPNIVQSARTTDYARLVSTLFALVD